MGRHRDTHIDEIADGVYRLSTHVGCGPDPRGISVNQFLVKAEEPLLFHTGLRAMFPSVVEALARVVPAPRLRWVSFGHVEADECGAMNLLLAVAPAARVAFGAYGSLVSLADLADRPPRVLAPGEALDLGGRRVVAIPTPHAPHNAEAQVLLEETTGTLLCGDLFSQAGVGPALTGTSLVEAAIATEAAWSAAAPGPPVPTALRALALLRPRTLAVMHGSSFEGDAGAALTDLADAWEARFGGPTSRLETPDNDKETEPC
jgi:flavorubredoxin